MNKVTLAIIFFFTLISAKPAWAQDAVGTITPPSNLFIDANSLINNIVGLVMAIAGLIFLFMLLWGGIRYMMAGGDPKNSQAARGVLTSAIIGLIIVVGAYMITGLLGTLLGFDFLHPTIPGIK